MSAEGCILADGHVQPDTGAALRGDGPTPRPRAADQGSTPVLSDFPLRSTNFAGLTPALDPAALGSTGCKSHGSSGEPDAHLPCAKLGRGTLMAGGLMTGNSGDAEAMARVLALAGVARQNVVRIFGSPLSLPRTSSGKLSRAREHESHEVGPYRESG